MSRLKLSEQESEEIREQVKEIRKEWDRFNDANDEDQAPYWTKENLAQKAEYEFIHDALYNLKILLSNTKDEREREIIDNGIRAINVLKGRAQSQQRFIEDIKYRVNLI